MSEITNNDDGKVTKVSRPRQVNSGLSQWDKDGVSREARAAIQYAEHGWPVLPGSAWSGDRYMNPRTARATRALRPLVARNLASADVRTVTRWWKGDTSLVPSVLVRCGESFNAVSVEHGLAENVLQMGEFRRHGGPVIYRPDEGQVYFLIEPGPVLWGQFDISPGELRIFLPGEWVAVPPTRLGDKERVRWWRTPDSVAWRPGDLTAFRNALTVVAQDRSAPSIERRQARG